MMKQVTQKQINKARRIFLTGKDAWDNHELTRHVKYCQAENDDKRNLEYANINYKLKYLIMNGYITI